MVRYFFLSLKSNYEGFSDDPKNKLFVEMLADKFLGRKDVLLTILQGKYAKDFPETKIVFDWFLSKVHIVNANEAISSIAHVFGTDKQLLAFGNQLMSKLSTGVKSVLVFQCKYHSNKK